MERVIRKIVYTDVMLSVDIIVKRSESKVIVDNHYTVAQYTSATIKGLEKEVEFCAWYNIQADGYELAISFAKYEFEISKSLLKFVKKCFTEFDKQYQFA